MLIAVIIAASARCASRVSAVARQGKEQARFVARNSVSSARRMIPDFSKTVQTLRAQAVQ
jgi:hypothetical protein